MPSSEAKPKHYQTFTTWHEIIIKQRHYSVNILRR